MTELSKEQRELMAKLLKQKGLDSKAVEKKDEIKVSCDANRRYEPYPLTDIQQSYLLGRSQSFVLGNVASHAYIEMDIQNLDIPRYEYAWQKIIQRHDMLRTVVYENGMQQTLETVPEFRVIEHDFSSLETQEQKEQAFLDLRKSLSHQVLPTDQWPLFNIHVSTMDKKHYKIHWSFDAIILDVYSNFIFQEELYHYYHDDNTHYEPLELTFRDYVLTLKEQEQSASYEASEQYWFKGLETLPSAPVLPLKNELSMIQKPHFERLRYAMDEHLWQGLKQKSKKYGVTTTSVLLTAFSHVLHKWGRNPDFTLNMTVFNRPAWHEQMDKIVGDFTITMLLGINALSNDDKRFNTLAKHIQSKLFSDLEHRLYSGVNVIQHWSRISGSKQIAPIVFTSALTVGDIGENLDTKSSQLGEISYSITQTPQVLLDHQVYEENGQLITNWDYVDEAFESSLLTCMFTMYTQTLELLASSESIWDEPLLIETPVSQQNQREQFNETHDEKLLCLSQKPLYYSFNEQVHIQPDAFAVVSSQKSLTYKELAYYAYEVNRKLQKQGVKVGDNVAIILPKGWQQTVAVLGILACGATYIPIDSKSPKLRLNKLLCDANCNHIITVESTFESLSLSQDIKTVFIKNEIEQMYPEALEFWPMHHTLKDTAYIIYTSGSTGQPKGVMMGHNAVMNTILDINHRFNITHEDSVFGLSALNFDLSVYDIFGTLSVGAKLVLPDEGQDKNPQHWQECLAKNPCSVWNSVPALFQIFLEYGMPKTILDNFNTVMLSGDKITLPLAKLAQKSMQNANIFTLGGATEAAIWSIHYLLNDLNKDFKHVPYGIPLSNQSIHILDENLQPCPDYAVGKLYIGGVGLAKGYFNDNEKSQRHFIQNPHTNEYLYDTGDLGAFNPSLGGFIEFHGREDHQVKVGGFRIELGEIENSLNAHKHISKSLVRLINDASGQQSRQMLVAYIVSDETINENQLKAYLSDDLPEYMIPRFFIEMDEIPLSANGKVDDKALPKVDIEQKYHANYVSPKNDLEVSIQSIVSTHLGIQKASVEESLFDLGATSLDVVSIHQQLEKQLSLSLSILDLFDKPTIRAFSEHIASKDEKSNILDQARQKARSNTRRERLQRRKNQVGVESEV